MSGPKVTVIGAGSYFFGKPVIHKMASSEVMEGGTLALVDIDQGKLGTMLKLARRVLKETKSNVEVEGSTDRREVMPNSDFIVLTFSRRNAYYRGVDTGIAAKHGIRMCSADTIGPGGIFRALRTVPETIRIAQDSLELAPDAWVVNYVNPTTVLGMALRRYASDVKSFALCDGHHEPYNTLRWCKRAGIISEDAAHIPPEVYPKLDLAIAGVNHCTWLIRFRYKGEDMVPVVEEWLREEAENEKRNAREGSKARYNATYALTLYQIYGAIPTTVGHTKEYVPFFQGYGVAPVLPEPIRLFDAKRRAENMQAAWDKTEAYASGELSVGQFMREVSDDHATDIIESMWGDLRKPFFVNTTNGDAVTNLPPDAFLELRSDVDMQGPRPHPVGEMPRGILALQHQVLDTHELTAEAAVTGDRSLLRRAMLTDPICNNISDVDACIEGLLEAERDVLPDCWYD